jgi:hypothetical protein
VAKKTNKQKKYKTLLSVLANGSTDEARALLIKNSGEDAKNEQDLESKLARMYANSSSKIDIEKQFAEIHPHKDFILKYIKPKEELQQLKPLDAPVVSDEKIVDAGKMVIAHDGYSSANGECECQNTCPCMANKFSNATGESQVANNGSVNQTALVLGLVSVVAIFGMVLYLKQNK